MTEEVELSATTETPNDVVVHAEGKVSAAEKAYAQNKVGRVRKIAPGPVLFARVDLTAHNDPARERPNFAKAELDVNGNLVRARVAASSMLEAIDLLESRLRDRLERFAHHEESKHLRHRDPSDWHHGDLATSRPPYFPRPVDERQIVRQKTFAVGEMTPDEAAFDLELLDHDFYLFVNLETGEDNVITRAGGAGYELLEPSATCSLADTTAAITHSPIRPTAIAVEGAIEMLDIAGEQFVFFIDPNTHRGRVLYRRYDGHYGLIVAADDDSES